MTSPTPSTTARRLRGARVLSGTLSAGTAIAVLVAGAPADVAPRTPTASPSPTTTATDLTPVAATGRAWPGHPGRRIVVHRVKRGDTATGLAVRYHAWTRELRALNDLGRHSRLYVGRRIRIPVVVAAARRARKDRAATPAPRRTSRSRASGRPWAHADASRATVRSVIVRTAKRHGVNPRLALAISWQEAGWQQRRISSAGAIGAMQVMPGTGRWISTSYAGRRLNLHGLRDNVTAGVLLISVLQDLTSGGTVIGSYYQGLGSIRARGMYPSTRAYVRNVRALRGQLRTGWDPA